MYRYDKLHNTLSDKISESYIAFSIAIVVLKSELDK